ncbi:MAG: serine/threonine protein kinase [Deltaproteobacteria bacterium]|nr:serine/threonine protein kinase [Deltaproteobacteria bacterium]
MKSSKAGDEQGPQARVGTVIKGKWTVDGLLGVGGMAAVYAASHRNGQRAALKILHADFAREKTICERFLREAYVSNKVNHSATVQVLDDDVTEQGEPFLIMELLEGETVRDAWKKCGRTMPIGRVLQICERVLDCLASCHAINVIHRDLKPANIFIVIKEDEVKVLDFGVAQMRDATSERTATGTALGTPAYMSPEQAMGLVDQLDGRADLFSVGAMMHALITGHRINNGRTEQEALVMAATKPVPSVARLAPHLPIELIKVIDKALAWDRRNRFQDAREMQRALLELMPSQGVSPLAAKAPPRPDEVVAPPPPTAAPVAGAPAAAAPVQVPQHAPVPQVAPAPAPAAPPLAQAKATGQQQQHPAMRSQAGMPPAAPPPAPAYDPLVGYQPSLAPAPVQQAPITTEVPDNDPRVQALRDLMKHFDRVLPSVRQFGWAHPATERTLRTAYEAVAEALKQQPQLMSWTLRPYSFLNFGHTVWEPAAPFDAIPYNLFACGMRTLRFEQGITIEELREIFALFLLDPGRDLPPEDDLAAAFWERGLPHVKYECVDAFAEGDAAEREAFYGETDDLEKLAELAAQNQMNRIEARAMALSTDEKALGIVKERSPFALDDPMRNAILPQFELTREVWSERYVDALVEGYLDSAANRDAPLVLASLRKSAADLAVAGRIDVAVQLSHAIVERLRQRVQGAENQGKLAAALLNAMFGGETLELVLKRLKEDPTGLESFKGVLGSLGPNELPTVLSNIRDVTQAPLRTALAAFLERYLQGREGDIAGAIPGSDPDTVAVLLQLLSRSGTPAARQAIMQLAQGDDVNARVEARVLVAPSPEHAAQELSTLLDNPSALVRMAALRTMTRYSMRNAWPTVARVINGKNFNELGNDERRELLRAAIVLSPERGEPLALELAKKGGVLVSENREATRALAAELLGEFSRSRATGAALHELAQSRWGLSEETRMAASNAAKRIGQRLASTQGGATA